MSQAAANDLVSDHELDVLSQIHRNRGITQRDIARVIGLSLGMTNTILKRLAGKGFISMRRINARNIRYLVTPAGISLIAYRSYRYLRRTVGVIVRYKERLLEIFHAAARSAEGTGKTCVVLVGESDLEFLVEWCARKVGLAFRRESDVCDGTLIGGPSRETEYIVASDQLPVGNAEEGDLTAAGPARWWDFHLAQLAVPVMEHGPEASGEGRSRPR